MLALSDTQLALLAIAATRHSSAAGRARLLARFAAAVDPPRKLLNGRKRSMRARQRRRSGTRVWRLELPDVAVAGMVNALVAGGHLTAAQAQDPRAVERALARQLVEWGKHWTP